MFLSLKASALPSRAAALLLAAAAFAAGLAVGALMAPVSASRGVAVPAVRQLPMPSALRGGHRAEVLRVLDGDTFEARVRIWPGMDVTTKVRLRGIDAPEIHSRCADERTKAIAARDALAQILAEGSVGVARVTQDKYGGRVDAEVSTAATADVSAALLARGMARHYSGGRRQSWCS
jgi:endonuclease YncB( thermonuclease family)